MPAAVRAVVLVVSVLTVLLGLPTAATAGPAVWLSPDRGAVGSSTTVTAAGLLKKRTATITFGSIQVTARTDGAGRLSRTLSVPTAPDGPMTATVTTGAVTASTWFTVQSLTKEPTLRMRFGVSTPGGPQAGGELDQVAALAGESPSIIMFYRGFTAEPDLRDLDAVAGRGATPLLTWEPYDWTRGVDQPEYSLRRLQDGSYDPYLRRWADALKAWGKPVMLRFAHEMNGNWYPWSEGVNGNSSGDYVAAWRYVHGVFAAAQATNVSWVWSPNVAFDGSIPLAGLYPGDAYVDWVGLDGYNWGSAVPWHNWKSPAAVFDSSLAEVKAVAPNKRLLIAETSSTESGGDKAVWVSELFTWLSAKPEIEAMVWFHYDKETDWRIDSSPNAAAAFGEGMARR